VSDTNATDLPEGIVLIDRFRVERRISTGGMGAVYEATDAQSGAPVALKRLFDRRNATRFMIEARLLSQLRHRRVVRVLDHFEDESGMYLVMDLVRGVDLGRLLKKRGKPGLPVPEAIGYIVEACEALQYVHEQQIIHRDVKPENLILGGSGISLVDFGIAREVRDETSGTVGIGTPRFMAPEMFGGAVSPRSDVFGVAATLWTLITGTPPLYGRLDLSSRVPDLSPQVERALAAGLEIIPERRIATADAFARALGSPLGHSGGTPLSLSVAGPSESLSLLEAVVRTAAGIFEAASASIALTDVATEELVYQAAWGAGAAEIVGVRLPRASGIAGAVLEAGQGEVIPNCKEDPRFYTQIATGTGYVPNTMLVVPLKRKGSAIGVLSLLDRRDGEPYRADDVTRADLFADLALATLDTPTGARPDPETQPIAATFSKTDKRTPGATRPST
jgi:hypothetical protein